MALSRSLTEGASLPSNYNGILTLPPRLRGLVAMIAATLATEAAKSLMAASGFFDEEQGGKKDGL